MVGNGENRKAQRFTAFNKLFDSFGPGQRPGSGNVETEFHDLYLLRVLGAPLFINEYGYFTTGIGTGIDTGIGA